MDFDETQIAILIALNANNTRELVDKIRLAWNLFSNSLNLAIFCLLSREGGLDVRDFYPFL
jgi:hypothetical protein